MSDKKRTTRMDEAHEELPGIGRLVSAGAGGDGLAGAVFAYDESGSPLPCAVTIASDGNPFSIRVHGDMDIYSFDFLSEATGRIIASLAGRGEPGGRDLIIEMLHCDYMDSRGMGLLIKTARDLQAVGGRLSLAHLSPKVHKIFSLTGMDRLLTVLP